MQPGFCRTTQQYFPYTTFSWSVDLEGNTSHSPPYKGFSPGVFKVHLRSESREGDGSVPTPYWHGRYTEVGTYSYYYRYYRRGAHRYTEYKQQLASGPLSNPFLWRNLNSPGGISYPTGLDVERLDNQLLEKLNNQAIDLGTILGEALPTVRYVAYRGAQLARLGLCIVSGRWKRSIKMIVSKRKFNKIRKRHIKDNGFDAGSFVAASLLEFNFAIRPMVKDIADVTSLYLDPMAVAKTLRFVASSSVNHSDRHHSSVGDTSSTNTINGIARKKIVYSISDPDAVARKAFGLQNPARVIWEILPFSWLIDYVVNVGGWIGAMTAADGLTFQHGYLSFKGKENFSSSYSLDQSSTSVVYRVAQATRGTFEGYVRTPLAGFPKPTLQLTSGFTAGQFANVSALGTVLLNSYRRKSAIKAF